MSAEWWGAWAPLGLLVLGAVALVLVFNVYWPRFKPAPVALISFFAGWLTGELALHWVLVLGALAAALGAAGGLGAPTGVAGAAMLAVALFGLLRYHWRARLAEAAANGALVEALGERAELSAPARAGLKARLPKLSLVAPLPVWRRDVERLRDITFARHDGVFLRLDVWRPRGGPPAPPSGRPVLLWVHGGGWVVGSKDHHGLPVVQQLAANGFICVSVSYRLSPRATFPDHIIDVKAALRWIREHGADLGADPDFVIVSGGSAGGHLASLTALTANDPKFQPGFEEVDTTVQGCVPFYGVYDFTERHGAYRNPGLRKLLERHVLKCARGEHGQVWLDASPMHRAGAHAPPFLVIHGDRDTLVPVAEGRNFASLLRSVSQRPVGYLEVADAQHAFEIFPSPRTAAVLDAMTRFCVVLWDRYVRAKQAGAANEASPDRDAAA